MTSNDNYPSKTNVSCFWCTHTFVTIPWGIPLSYENEVFDLYGVFCSPNCACALLFSEEKFRDKFDIELHVDQITFPKREETYNERHLGQGRIYKTTSSVRNYSYSNYLSIYQGKLILITEVYNYYESGPCDTPGSVFSRNICHVHNGQCFKETFLDSEIITSLPKISLKDIK